jgi:hypothetical protein
MPCADHHWIRRYGLIAEDPSASSRVRKAKPVPIRVDDVHLSRLPGSIFRWLRRPDPASGDLAILDGRVREAGEIQEHKGDAVKIAHATVKFLDHVATGFSPSAYGNILLSEVSESTNSLIDIRRFQKTPSPLFEL